ncbi:MAG: hypothetical protein KDH92_01945 [Chloroflexi bacterium]|nr:hypothetical protein [Chloroflexota bacterium]
MFGKRLQPGRVVELTLLAALLAFMVGVLPRFAFGGDAGTAGTEPAVTSAHGSSIPLESTPGADPPSVPTLEVEGAWRLRLRAFPDSVGRGGYRCQGCDGVFTDGDEMGAIGQPLEPLLAVVSEPGNPDRRYWVGRLDRQNAGQAEVYTEALIFQPPPYEVRLVTTDPLGYTLCPNAPSVFYVEQADFDAIAGGGNGRNYARDWYFWRCRDAR